MQSPVACHPSSRSLGLSTGRGLGAGARGRLKFGRWWAWRWPACWLGSGVGLERHAAGCEANRSRGEGSLQRAGVEGVIPTRSSTAAVSRGSSWTARRTALALPSEVPPLRAGSPGAASTTDRHLSRTVGAATLASFRDLSMPIDSDDDLQCHQGSPPPATEAGKPRRRQTL